MGWQRFTTEGIVRKLREAEIALPVGMRKIEFIVYFSMPPFARHLHTQQEWGEVLNDNMYDDTCLFRFCGSSTYHGVVLFLVESKCLGSLGQINESLRRCNQ